MWLKYDPQPFYFDQSERDRTCVNIIKDTHLEIDPLVLEKIKYIGFDVCQNAVCYTNDSYAICVVIIRLLKLVLNAIFPTFCH